MPTSAENSTVLPIITALKAHVSPIGTPDGVAGLTASTISSLAAGGNLKTLLPPSLLAACRERVTEHRFSEGGYDPLIAGFELVGPVNETELAEGRIIAAAALRPSPPATVTRELTRLRFATASREFNAAEMTMIGAIYAETLVEYPEDIVIAVCRDWVKRGGKFWPALAELTEPADRLVKERLDLAEALARGPAPPREPNPADTERRRLVAERDRQWAETAAFRDAHPELMEPRPAPPRPEGEKPMRSIGDLAAGFRLPDVNAPEVQKWLSAMETE